MHYNALLANKICFHFKVKTSDKFFLTQKLNDLSNLKKINAVKQIFQFIYYNHHISYIVSFLNNLSPTSDFFYIKRFSLIFNY